MKTLCAVAGTALVTCNLVCFGQTYAVCRQTLDAPLQSRTALTIDSRPAGLEIVGTDQKTIHVTCTADDVDAAQQIHLQFSGLADAGKLAIIGGSARHGNVQVRIEVPRKTSLRVHMPAGQVKVEEIVGNKDIDLYAGQIKIFSTRDWNYRNVDASVDIGEVNARVYGVNKGGFFRSFTEKAMDGEYRLRAHVMTGQIELLGTNTHARARWQDLGTIAQRWESTFFFKSRRLVRSDLQWSEHTFWHLHRRITKWSEVKVG
jgi:hypothetical protein